LEAVSKFLYANNICISLTGRKLYYYGIPPETAISEESNPVRKRETPENYNRKSFGRTVRDYVVE